ncbi:hypothetical protein AURDEDRAFT_177887 [Auricularia subglabra TFB-10046 SS5]|uniref:Uncharacterized protein n=1 Tax=Auricularia subglabra (strain TFB-10046 / SS5) TaxID=717982 RepID=J0D2Z7_AURST|nr:hypothetical protein AURDEDRAFT_177887 [Auricularia subglabra TFB-10046 SS5]
MCRCTQTAAAALLVISGDWPVYATFETDACDPLLADMFNLRNYVMLVHYQFKTLNIANIAAKGRHNVIIYHDSRVFGPTTGSAMLALIR